jgi:hypothetical protein
VDGTNAGQLPVAAGVLGDAAQGGTRFAPVAVFGWRSGETVYLRVPGNPTNDWSNVAAAAAFTSDATKPPRKPTIWERLRRLLRRFPRKALRALWIVPIYLAIALLVDMNLDPQPIGGGLGACAIDTTPVPLYAKERSFGPKAALADAQDELARQCSAAAIDCTDPACPTCGNDVLVSTVDISSYLLFYVAEVTGDCRCWCQ